VGYQQGCAACQWFGNIQMTPASLLNPIVKPWPFRGWGVDFIGEIHPSSSTSTDSSWSLLITL
jgi:hypothetical protein